MLPVVILAGGLATRLGAASAATPKLLLEVAGRPFAEHQLAWLQREGVRDVIYAVGHLGEQIEATLGDGARWGMRFRYAYDGPRLVGTGGALKRAQPLWGERTFVLYGDSYLTCRLAPVEHASDAGGGVCVMTVFRNDGQWDASNVRFDHGRLLAYDKVHRDPAMHHIDYGLGIVTAAALAPYADGEPLDLARVYQDALAAGRLAAVEVHERFYEIGSPAGLAETRRWLGEKGTDT